MSTAAPQLEQPPAPPQPLPSSAFVIQHSDPVEWTQTPAPVAVKLRQLRRERDDARLTWRGIADELKAVRENKRVAEARLKRITRSPDTQWFEGLHDQFGPADESHPDVIAMRKQLALADSELARLQPIAAAREQVLHQLGRLVENIERYFEERLRGVRTIELHNGRPKPALKKGEGPLDALERGRGRVRELEADRQRIVSAPWHSDYAKAKARAEIDALAARGKPDVTALVQTRDGAIGFRERPFAERTLGGRAIAVEYDPAPVPLIAWLHKDLLIERLEKEIDAASDDKHALTHEQRTTRLAAIEAERLAVEREEEHWACEAMKGGANILRRPELDPRAALALSDSLPAPQR